MSRSEHLPAQALTDWAQEVSALLELDQPLDMDTDGALVLDLTRQIAAEVARPAGPLTMFMLGLALGPEHKAGGPLGPRLTELAEEVRQLADRKGAEVVNEKWRNR